MKSHIELSKKAIILILGIGLVVLIFTAIIWPLFTKVSHVSSEAKILDFELIEVRSVLQRIDEIDQDKHLLSRNEISQAISEIVKMGTDLNINFLSTSPQPIEKPQGSKYPVLPISMEVQSQYKDLGIFLGALEKRSNSIVTVTEFSIERNPEILPNIQTDLVVEIYLGTDQGG